MKKNYAFVICAILISIIFIPIALELPDASEVSTLIGPKAWPLSLLVLILILSILLAIQLYFRKNNINEEAASELEEYASEIEQELEKETQPETTFDKNRHWVLLVFITVYTILMQFIGFFIATGIFIFVCTLIFGMKNLKHSLITTTGGLVMFYVFFVVLLDIPLP